MDTGRLNPGSPACPRTTRRAISPAPCEVLHNTSLWSLFHSSFRCPVRREQRTCLCQLPPRGGRRVCHCLWIQLVSVCEHQTLHSLGCLESGHGLLRGRRVPGIQDCLQGPCCGREKPGRRGRREDGNVSDLQGCLRGPQPGPAEAVRVAPRSGARLRSPQLFRQYVDICGHLKAIYSFFMYFSQFNKSPV